MPAGSARGLVRTSGVVVPGVLVEDNAQVAFADDKHGSVHSARTVFTQRSAKAFIFEHCGAAFLISMFLVAKTASNASVKMESRSRIRYRNRSARSPASARKFLTNPGSPKPRLGARWP